MLMSFCIFFRFLKNDVSYQNLGMEDATELALDRPFWRLLAAAYWNGDDDDDDDDDGDDDDDDDDDVVYCRISERRTVIWCSVTSSDYLRTAILL